MLLFGHSPSVGGSLKELPLLHFWTCLILHTIFSEHYCSATMRKLVCSSELMSILSICFICSRWSEAQDYGRYIWRRRWLWNRLVVLIVFMTLISYKFTLNSIKSALDFKGSVYIGLRVKGIPHVLFSLSAS